jgi:hypothetical protein
LSKRWKRERIVGNDGKSLDLYCRGEYRIALNINRGKGGKKNLDRDGYSWAFEVTALENGGERTVGEADDLTEAKSVASRDERRKGNG